MKNRLFSPRKHQQQQQEGQQQQPQEEVRESSSAAATTTSSIASVTSPPYPDTLSRSGNENDSTTTTRPSILWSAILRNDTILVEADLGAAVHKEVEEASTLLLQKPPTPGWEHATLGKRKVQAAAAAAESGSNGYNDANHNHNGNLKGMKFHVYEHFAEKEDDQRDDDDGEAWKDYDTALPKRPVQRRYKNEGLTIWTFACVYDPTLVDFIQVQSFLEKVVTVTEIFRQPTVHEAASKQQQEDDADDPRDEQQVTIGNLNPFDDDDLPPHAAFTTNHRSPQDVWRYGSHHAAQYFAPVLLQRMEEVSYHGKLAMCHEKVDAVKEIMSRNIDLILENEERLAHGTLERAVQLNEMAQVFAKRSKQVKRQMLWNNAKHGAILGTAITAGVAVCVVPPLVALL